MTRLKPITSSHGYPAKFRPVDGVMVSDGLPMYALPSVLTRVFYSRLVLEKLGTNVCGEPNIAV